MSTNLQTAKAQYGQGVQEVKVTSFSGGNLGQMLQLHTGYRGDVSIIQATEEQVRSLHATMGKWLAGR